MIELSFTELGAVVVGGAMGFVLLLAWVSRWSRKKEWERTRDQQRVCRLCLAVFVPPSRDRIQQCPECGARTGPKGPRPLG